MQPLDEAERRREIGDLPLLFTETAELRTIGLETPLEGREGVRKFWLDYLASFQGFHTNFLHVIEGRGGVALEWIGEGVLPSGESIAYSGVTVLELENGLIRRLRTYHDAAAPQRSAPASAGASSGTSSSGG